MTISDEAVEAAVRRYHQSGLECSPDAMRAALEAAAPHLYPASGEVGRALTPEERDMMGRAVQRSAKPLYDLSASGGVGGEKRVQEAAAALKADADALLLKADPEMAARVALGAALLETLLSALSEATERAGRMERERDEARAAFALRDQMLTIAQAEATRLKEKLDEAEAKVKELLGLLAPFLPINARDTPDYAELSFGDHQTQAMTMQPNDWIALSTAALRWTEEASQGEGE